MPDRMLLLLGSAAARSDTPSRAGLMVRGQLPELDLDEWLALYAKEKPRGATGAARSGYAVEMNGVELDVGKLDVFGRVLHDLKVTAERAVFVMRDCRVQSARKRKGLPDFPCKSVGVVEYGEFAKTIDPRIRTRCIACPPDAHAAGNRS